MADLEEARTALSRLPDAVALLESLFALAPVGLQIYEVSGRSILVNQAFIEMFGVEPPPEYNVLQDEIAAKNGVLELIRRAFKGERISTPPIWYDPRELTQVKMEKGNRVAMSATFFPLRDRSGAVSHVAIAFKDLTAEMVQREQLEEERELLSAIVDQVSEGILMADEGGISRLVNRAARELGYRPGSPAQTARSHAGRVLDWRTVPLRRPDGRPRGTVSTFRDDTERVRREQEAEQTAHFRERFIGILGHDLRSPLAAIAAGAALILRHKDSPDPVLAASARIGHSSERMARMISDLLDFTQARLGGGLALKRADCDLRDVARAVIDEVSIGDPTRTIALHAEGDTRGNFDPDRVAQLLSNLLMNALAYAPLGEEIAVVVAGRIGEVEIAVSNGGAPIAEEDREVIFDPFRRGRSAKESRGLGLGLFIVQQIALAHGGTASVESRDGRTTFRATFQR